MDLSDLSPRMSQNTKNSFNIVHFVEGCNSYWILFRMIVKKVAGTRFT